MVFQKFELILDGKSRFCFWSFAWDKFDSFGFEKLDCFELRIFDRVAGVDEALMEQGGVVFERRMLTDDVKDVLFKVLFLEEW